MGRGVGSVTDINRVQKVGRDNEKKRNKKKKKNKKKNKKTKKKKEKKKKKKKKQKKEKKKNSQDVCVKRKENIRVTRVELEQGEGEFIKHLMHARPTCSNTVLTFSLS